MKIHDPRQDVSEKELTEMLRAYEGPREPLRASRQTSLRWPSRRLLVGGALALVVLASVVGGILQGRNRPAENASCAALLDYGGIRYIGNSLNGVPVELGAALGTGVVPGCADSVRVNNDTGETTVDRSSAQQAQVYSLRGIEPRVAVARADQPGIVYVAPGRCVGYSSDAKFVRCLREPLRFQGQLFVGTKLLPRSETRRLVTTESIGQGQLGAQPVDVVRLQGIARTRAVGLAGDASTVYVTIADCYAETGGTLLQCLSKP